MGQASFAGAVATDCYGHCYAGCYAGCYGLGVHPYFEPPLPHLFAHRGASGEAPENTLPAFERAVEIGFRFLELDCHGTSDGEVVICHDADLARTTGVPGLVRERSLAELRALDAGSEFTPDGRSHPFRGKGVRMPLLHEVLDAFPDARLNLEVKQAEPAIVDEVVSILRSRDALQRVLLAAAEDEIMAQIRRADPGTAIGSSGADVVAFYRALAEGVEPDPAGDALQIPPSFAGNPLVTPEAVRAAERRGVFIHVWTINEPGEMRELLERGAHGIMSDHPSRLLEVASAWRGGA